MFQMNNKTSFKIKLHFEAPNHVGTFSLATKPNNHQRDTQPHYKSLASRIPPKTQRAFIISLIVARIIYFKICILSIETHV
jgi:hypothetical protein